MPDISKILERSEAILTGKATPSRERLFKTYAISNFRGGIGKSILAFNLAYELSRNHRTLLLDTCSQRNFTQNLMGDDIFGVALYNLRRTCERCDRWRIRHASRSGMDCWTDRRPRPKAGTAWII